MAASLRFVYIFRAYMLSLVGDNVGYVLWMIHFMLINIS